MVFVPESSSMAAQNLFMAGGSRQKCGHEGSAANLLPHAEMPPDGRDELRDQLAFCVGHGPCNSTARMPERWRSMWNPSAEKHLEVLREFLQREFRDCHHRDYFQLNPPAQIFIVETKRDVTHTLVVPKATFVEAPDFPSLCNGQLVDALEAAPDGRVTLTPHGLDVRP
jgi:hypothetical protein